MPVSYSDIGLQEPSTITNRVAAVTVVRNSTAMQQELLTLADPQTSNALARIVDTTPDSTMFGIVVREAVPQSTTVAVSSVAGTVTVTPAAGSTFTVRAMQSSAADLNVTVAGYSTTVNVSSVGGRVLVAPSDTNWASSAGFHLNSSGELLVKDAGNSTTVSVANTVSVQPAAGSTWTVHLGAEHQSTAVAPSNSSALNVRVVGGVSSAADFKVYAMPASTLWASSAGFHFDSSGGLQVNAGSIATSTTVNVSSVAGVVLTAMQDSSNVLVHAGDAVNQAIRVNVVAGAAGGSTVVTVSTGSMRVHQSTAADLNVTVAGYSTTVNVSSVSGVVTVIPTAGLHSTSAQNSNSSALHVRVVGGVSSAADFPVAVSSVAGVVTVTPVAWDSTYVSGSKGTSGDTTILSSAASTRWAIFGYQISIDSTTPTTVRLVSSAASTVEMARWVFRAPSSIGVGANMAVPMPAYLYQSAPTGAVVLHTDSTATVNYTFMAYRKS